ncbi:MAG: hypothetical protein WC250_00285 [Candidatus Paceibacterota bacterium]|jgi:hypothetical protein
MNLRQLIGKLLHKTRASAARSTLIEMLSLLKEYPDQQETATRRRVVMAIIRIIEEFPKEIFLHSDRSAKRLPGATQNQFGWVMRLVANKDFPERAMFVGFVGDKPDERFAIKILLEADRNRPKPVYAYSIEVTGEGSKTILKALAFHESKDQLSEGGPYARAHQIDAILNEQESASLISAFINLTSTED